MPAPKLTDIGVTVAALDQPGAAVLLEIEKELYVTSFVVVL